MSGASTRKCSASGRTLRIQWVHEPDAPCNSTSGGPSPHARHTITPLATGVTVRVAAEATRATYASGSSIVRSGAAEPTRAGRADQVGPVHRLLVGRRGLDQRVLAEVGRHQHQPDRQPADLGAQHAYGRDARVV